MDCKPLGTITCLWKSGLRSLRDYPRRYPSERGASHPSARKKIRVVGSGRTLVVLVGTFSGDVEVERGKKGRSQQGGAVAAPFVRTRESFEVFACDHHASASTVVAWEAGMLEEAVLEQRLQEGGAVEIALVRPVMICSSESCLAVPDDLVQVALLIIEEVLQEHCFVYEFLEEEQQ